MNARTALLTLVVAALAVTSAGCSKEKEKTELQGQIAQLESRIKEMETKAKEAADLADKASLQMANEKRELEEELKASQVRLMHHPIEEITVQPAASMENGWLIIDGQRTYTLSGHTGATRVRFYWADAEGDRKANLLGEDTYGADGWSWTGTLPFGTTKAFWAEVQYPGGVKTVSAALPVRSGGK